jgi:hypothetical protein
MTATSKTGMIPSPLPGERGGAASEGAVVAAAEPSSPTLNAGGATASAPVGDPPTLGAGGATVGAAVAALVSTGCSRHTFGMPKTSAATHTATSARDTTAIRLIDVAVMVCDRWPNRWLVSTPEVTLPLFVPVIKCRERVSWPPCGGCKAAHQRTRPAAGRQTSPSCRICCSGRKLGAQRSRREMVVLSFRAKRNLR